MKRTLSLTLTALIASCASHPSDIAPSVVVASEYRDLSCEGLRDALTEAQATLDQAADQQHRKRIADGIGNALVIPGLLTDLPPVSGLLGILVRDSREAVAQHKGEVLTIATEMDSRDCRDDE